MDADLTVSETKNIYSPMKGDPTQGIVDIQEQTSMEEDYLNFGLDSPPSALVNLNLASASSAAGSAFEPSLHQQQTTIENSEFENMDYLNLPNNDSMVIGNTIGRENDYFDPENALHTAGKEDVVSVDCKVSAHTRTIMSGLFEVEKVGSIAPEINSMENGKLEINHEQGSFIEQINPVGNQMDHQDCPSETNHPDQIFIDSKEEKSYENNHGPRVTHFRSALRKMLQATIKSCS